MEHHKKVDKEKSNASSYQDNDLVVCTKTGTPINPRNLLHSFYDIMKKADVPKIRFKVVKEILGHSDIRVTLDTYSHVLPSVHKETANKYGEMLFT